MLFNTNSPLFFIEISTPPPHPSLIWFYLMFQHPRLFGTQKQYFILTPFKLSLVPNTKKGTHFSHFFQPPCNIYLLVQILQKNHPKMYWSWTGCCYFQIENEVIGPVLKYTWSQIKWSGLAFYKINDWGRGRRL